MITTPHAAFMVPLSPCSLSLSTAPLRFTTTLGFAAARATFGSSSSSQSSASTSETLEDNVVVDDNVGAKLNLREDGTSQRFYRRAGVQYQGNAKAYVVTLDGSVLRTPARRPLTFASQTLAQAVAAEWEYQDARAIRPFTMPLMAISSTSVDRTPYMRNDIVENLIKHLHTDGALCRNPSEGRALHPAFQPSEEDQAHVNKLSSQLSKVQAALLDPVLRRVENVLGDGATLVPSDSLLGAPQSEETEDAVRRHAKSLDDAELTALDALCSSCKSVALGIALFHRLHEPLDDAWINNSSEYPATDDDELRDEARKLRFGDPQVSLPVLLPRVEEEWQAVNWGVVEGGHDIDRSDLKVRVYAPMAFLRLRQEP